jgi:hypothetical protein
MEDAIVDILHADMVLVGVSLLNQPATRDAFAHAIGTDVSITEVGMGQSTTGDAPTPLQTTVSIPRDRISITQDPSKTVIRRDYPSREHLDEDIGQLAKVAETAIRQSDWAIQTKSAHGYNMSCTFNLGLPSPAVHYIQDRLLQPKFVGQLFGATARLIFVDNDGRRLTFDVQPRPNNDLTSRLLYVALNIHFQESKMPSPDRILNSLTDLRSEITDFMTQLHKAP